MRLTTLMLLSAAVLASTPVWAKDQLAVGFAYGKAQTAYGFNRNRWLPLFQAKTNWLNLHGTTLDLSLPHSSQQSPGLMLRVRYDALGYNASDAEQLAGMSTRANSLWVGPALQQKLGNYIVSADLLLDGSSHSDGRQADLSIVRPYRLSRVWVALPSLRMNWQDGSMANYYAGVSNAEQSTNRYAYQAGNTINLSASLANMVYLSSHQSLVLSVNLTRLGNGYANSPIVTRRYLAGWFIGYRYAF